MKLPIKQAIRIAGPGTSALRLFLAGYGGGRYSRERRVPQFVSQM